MMIHNVSANPIRDTCDTVFTISREKCGSNANTYPSILRWTSSWIDDRLGCFNTVLFELAFVDVIKVQRHSTILYEREAHSTCARLAW